MRRLVIPALLLVLMACPWKTKVVGGGGDTGDTAADTGDPAACVPTGTRVPEGVYGGPHYELTVAADGSAELLGDCSLATVGSADVNEGVVSWTFSWRSGYGLPVQDTASIEYQDVDFVGTFCGGELAGTLTFPEGYTATLAVKRGVAAEIYACQ